MKVIDAHLHFSNVNCLKKTAAEVSFVDYSINGLNREFRDSDVIMGVAMGLTESKSGSFPDISSPNPMGLDLTGEKPDFLNYCIGINPVKLNCDNLDVELSNIELSIKEDVIVGFKLYTGYYHYYATDQLYTPIYELASKYHLPVVLHGGDTYSENGLLKYAHPLSFDELAVRYRDINFIIAHFGMPWVIDTAEVIAKNSNVFADLSGLVVGNAAKINRFRNTSLFMEYIQRAIIFTDCYDKILFGSDWPIVPVKPYLDLIKDLIPLEFHEDVFYNNALKVFPKIQNLKMQY